MDDGGVGRGSTYETYMMCMFKFDGVNVGVHKLSCHPLAFPFMYNYSEYLFFT